MDLVSTFCLAVIAVVAYIAVYVMLFAVLPSPTRLAQPCVKRGGVQQIQQGLTRPTRAIVVCRDGTVHEVKP